MAVSFTVADAINALVRQNPETDPLASLPLYTSEGDRITSMDLVVDEDGPYILCDTE